MKHDFTIIENTKEAHDNFGHGCGSDESEITQEDIEALLAGKCIAFDDGEYAHFISMKPINDD